MNNNRNLYSAISVVMCLFWTVVVIWVAESDVLKAISAIAVQIWSAAALIISVNRNDRP